MQKLSLVPCLLLAGCISTQEMPVAPNAVRLDTDAKGFLFTGQTVPQTMRRAAQLCLQGGYTHFTLAQVESQQGAVNTGAITSCNGGFCTASNVSAPVTHAGGTATFWHPNDAAVKSGQAFDCNQVLAQYSQ
jgi:hypothetical protein